MGLCRVGEDLRSRGRQPERDGIGVVTAVLVVLVAFLRTAARRHLDAASAAGMALPALGTKPVPVTAATLEGHSP